MFLILPLRCKNQYKRSLRRPSNGEESRSMGRKPDFARFGTEFPPQALLFFCDFVVEDIFDQRLQQALRKKFVEFWLQ